MARIIEMPGRGAAKRQREIHHGTRIATVPGATSRNRAEPKMAKVRLTPVLRVVSSLALIFIYLRLCEREKDSAPHRAYTALKSNPHATGGVSTNSN